MQPRQTADIFEIADFDNKKYWYQLPRCQTLNHILLGIIGWWIPGRVFFFSVESLVELEQYLSLPTALILIFNYAKWGSVR